MELLADSKWLELEDRVFREKEFYNSPFYFSYSSLNKLLRNPAQFYQEYVLGLKEEKTDRHLLEGKVIHALLLNETQFNTLFVKVPGKLPSENTKKILDTIYKSICRKSSSISQNEISQTTLNNFRNQILSILRDKDLHQSLVDEKDKVGNVIKSADEKRMEKIVTRDAVDYWNFLVTKGKKDIVDQDIYDHCSRCVTKIKSTPNVMHLLGMDQDEFSNVEIINEHYLKYNLKFYPFGIHGIIDNLVIDHDSKLIRINDIKTTSKELKDFEDSVQYYLYWVQAVIYVMLVLRNYRHLIDDEYQIEFRFIVIDRYHHVYPFLVSPQTMEQWTRQFNNQCLFKALYHYKQRSYLLPYEYAEDQVIL